MNPIAIMAELGEQLSTIDGLRVYPYPADSIQYPAAVIPYPEINFDQTYGNGLARMEYKIYVLPGKSLDRTTPALIDPFVAGSGDKSIKEVIEAGSYTEFDAATVSLVEFEQVTYGEITSLAAVFTLNIFGNGG